MEDTLLQTALGEFHLKRFPTRHPKSLRAWDAADEYLIDYATEHLLAAGQQDGDQARHKRLLLLNDMFGALSLGLHTQDIATISDSFVSRQGIMANFELNRLEQSACDFYFSVADLPIDYQPDAVLIKLPKDLDFFKAQLGCIASRLKPATTVIAAGMIKHMEHSYSQALEHYIGPCTASLAKKKARLLIARHTVTTQTAFPQQARYVCELNGLNMINFPNTFSYGQLDSGARLFINTMQNIKPQADTILDLGCGDGILGLSAARLLPAAKLCFIDNSNSALCSAQASAAENFSSNERFSFLHGDCLQNYAGPKADWILCNPPFHQEYTISTHVAKQMFYHAARCLQPDGRLWVIGNRHLRYQQNLRRLFTLVRQIGGNDKFLIFEAKFN